MSRFFDEAPGPSDPATARGDGEQGDGEQARPDFAFPPGDGERVEIVETQVVSGAPVAPQAPAAPHAPAVPQLQYFQPPGRFLTPRKWRQNAHGWVWAVSVAGALILAALTVGALVLGFLHQYRFTASGTAQVDCQTRTALHDPSLGEGARVELFPIDSDRRVADTRLDRFTDVHAGAGACFLSFRVDDVPGGTGARYLLQVGDAPGRVVSRTQLELGVTLGR